MPKTKSKQWVSTSRAAEALGCSPKFLRGNVDRLFRRGKEYRILDPTAWRPTYRWNLAAIQKIMDSGDP